MDVYDFLGHIRSTSKTLKRASGQGALLVLGHNAQKDLLGKNKP